MDFKKWLVKIFIVNESMTSVGLTQETEKCKGIATLPVVQISSYQELSIAERKTAANNPQKNARGEERGNK